jgi:hypothetical protein
MQPPSTKSTSINTPPMGLLDQCVCLDLLPLIEAGHCPLLSPQANARPTPDREIHIPCASKSLPSAPRLPYNPHREIAAVQFNRLYP